MKAEIETAGRRAGNTKDEDREDSEENTAEASDPNIMTSLVRGLSVIQAFSRQRQMLTISQISQMTDIPRAAVRRCLYTLKALGFADTDGGHQYFLRPRILSLGHAYLTSAPLARSAQPMLLRLSENLNESTSVAILDGDDILYIARASVTRIMTIDLNIGSRLPAAYTSMGRVLLAALPDDQIDACLLRIRSPRYTAYTLANDGALKAEILRVRAIGYSIVDQELEIGLRSIAVPIKAADGRAVASINVGMHASQVGIEELERRMLPALKDTAAELSLLLV